MTAPALTEAQFQQQVIDLARLRGWWLFHDNSTQGRNQAGLPDLILIRERVVYAELKTDRGRLRPGQRDVLARLRAAGAEVHVWRPAYLADVARTLAPAGPHPVAPAVPVDVLRARLEAVLALHQEDDGTGRCTTCVDLLPAYWPCPTVRAARGETA